MGKVTIHPLSETDADAASGEVINDAVRHLKRIGKAEFMSLLAEVCWQPQPPWIGTSHPEDLPMTTYLRYAPDIETPAADEQEAIDGIIKGMTEQSETVETREHHAVRASHAKSSACVIGTLTVASDLPPQLSQGLFATS